MNRRQLLAATTLAAPLTVFAQSEPAPTYDTTANLAPVVVTATRTATPVNETAATVSVLTTADFDRHKVTNLADALELMHGVTVVRSGTPGQLTSLFTRGSESNHTLMTLDGRRLPSRLDGTYDWESLTLDNVERIEFVRSSNSALFGANAIGGVVNIVTKSGRGLKQPEYKATFEAGSFQTFQESLSFRGAHEKVDYSLALSQFNAAFPRPNNEYQRSVVRGSLGYEASDSLYLDVKASFYKTDAGSPGNINFGGSLTDYLEREVFNVSPGITWQPNDRYQSKLFYSFENQLQPSLTFGSTVRLNMASHVIDWQNSYEVSDKWLLTGGLLFQDQEVDQTTSSTTTFPIHASTGTVGVYAQSQWQPVDNLSVITALRYDSFTDYKSDYTWRQGLAYTFEQTGTVLFGNASRSIAAPSPQDLYFSADNAAWFFKAAGNPNLKPERAQSFEVGVRQKALQDQLEVSATYFRSDYRDLITFVSRTYPAASTAENVKDALTEGIETSLTLKPSENLTSRLSFTYLTAVDESTDTRLLRRPRQQLNLSLAYTPSDKLTLAANLNGVFDRLDVGNVKLQDYMTLSATASYRHTDNVEFWVRGDNLTDVKYEPIAGFPALRLGVYGGIGLTF